MQTQRIKKEKRRKEDVRSKTFNIFVGNNRN